MEQTDRAVRVGIDAGEVWAFPEIATLTAPGQVFRGVATTVLPRHDVLEMKRPQWQMIFVEVTVFAAASGALAHSLAKPCGNHAGCLSR
jgi:hypothetical protein